MTAIVKISARLFVAAVALVATYAPAPAARGCEFRRQLERSYYDEQRPLRPILSLRSVHS